MTAGTKANFKLELITSASCEPRSVVLSISDWEKIAETLNITSSNELMESIGRAKAELRKGLPLLTTEETFADL